MNLTNLTFHVDPGHGWLEVPVSVIENLGIKDKISEWSYISSDRKIAFLEEDCDMGVFIRAAKENNHEVDYKIERHNVRPNFTNGDKFS